MDADVADADVADADVADADVADADVVGTCLKKIYIYINIISNH
jgi:hypothetical protein